MPSVSASHPRIEAGGCTGGAVRCRTASAPVVVRSCHCHGCQRETRAAFALNALVEPSASRHSTLTVAAVLLLFAALVVATAGWIGIGLPRSLLARLSCALALRLWLRAVGDFRYVGFSARVRGSRFAELNTRVYSPLCLLLAAGLAFEAWRLGASRRDAASPRP